MIRDDRSYHPTEVCNELPHDSELSESLLLLPLTMSLHRDQMPPNSSVEEHDDEDDSEEILEAVNVHSGVLKVEAASKIYGRYSRIALFTGCVSKNLKENFPLIS